jgi:tyrosyl-tRNA synthetase
MVHSAEDYETAVEASQILFGGSTSEALKKLDEATFLDVFSGVQVYEISKDELAAGIKAVDLLAEKTAVFPSKGEMRKTVQAGGVSINKEKLTEFDALINSSSLIGGKYIVAQKGKKNYFLIVAK